MSVNTKDEEIQEQVLQAAKKLFQIHGFRRVTIDDIAKTIGKARSSLYYYYKTKEEILDAVIADEISELMISIAAAISQVQTIEEKLKAFFLTKMQTALEKREFLNVLDEGMNAGELYGFQKTKLAVHNKIWQQEGALLNQIITEGTRRGELTKLSEKDQEELVFVLLSSLRGIKREMVVLNDYSNMELSIQVLVHSLIHGLKK